MASEAIYIEIYKKLKSMILNGETKNGDLLPTEMELAQKFFTSRITIQKAMRLLTKEGYVKRIAGRGTYVDFSIKAGSTENIIGVALCNIGASFGMDLMISLEKISSERGYSIILKNTRDDIDLEARCIDEFVALGAKGIIVQPVHGEFYNEKIIRHHLNKFPIVFIDRNMSGFNIPYISTDNSAAAEETVQYLFDMGHENIGFICFAPTNTSTVDDRINGFKSTYFKNNKLLRTNNIMSEIKSPGELTQNIWDEDVERIIQYLNLNPDMTALIASEFTVAKLVLTAIEKMNKKIPDDYSFVMFDKTESIFENTVTHIEQDQQSIAETAFDILIKQINNEPTPDNLRIPHKLIDGKTVKRI